MKRVDGVSAAGRQIEVTLLGTGTSHGIPMIACSCPVCRSDDPRDRRFRTAAAVRLPAEPPTFGQVLLIDAPPELRLASVRDGLDRVDAVLLTHAHADHIMGMDDLRRFNNVRGEQLPVYAQPDALEIARAVFSYADGPYAHPDRPSLRFVAVNEPFEVCGTLVTPIPLIHGRLEVLGFRVGSFAYCTDCSAIPEASLPLLADLDVLVIDALRYTPHPAHFNLPQALAAVELIRPRRAVLTHIAHEISHARTSAELPGGAELAVDGMRLTASL